MAMSGQYPHLYVGEYRACVEQMRLNGHHPRQTVWVGDSGSARRLNRHRTVASINWCYGSERLGPEGHALISMLAVEEVG